MRWKPIIAALAVCAVLLSCDSEVPESLLPDMMGVWKTSESKYEGCFFELRMDKISFINNAHLDKFLIYRVSKIEITTPRVKKYLCTVYYKGSEGQKYEFAFYYDPSEGGSIRFKNQITIKWEKAGTARIDKVLMEYSECESCPRTIARNIH